MKILSVKPLDFISFWTYEKSLKCKFASFENTVVLSRKKTKSNYSRVQISGLLYHELVDAFRAGQIEISSVDSFELATRAFLNKYSSKFNFGNEDILNWKESESIIDFIIEEAKRDLTLPSNKTAYPEHEIRLVEEKLLGRPDLFLEDSDGFHIIEYKSGTLFRNEQLKEEYVRQLHFYCGLISKAFHLIPKKLILLSLVDGRREVRFDPSLLENITSNAQLTFNELNSKICSLSIPQLNENLATPTVEGCIHCTLRPVCDKFLATSKEFKTDEAVYACYGDISEVAFVSNHSFCTINLKTESGILTIVNVPKNQISGIQAGTFLVVLNLKKNKNDVYQFEKYSRIEIYE